MGCYVWIIFLLRCQIRALNGNIVAKVAGMNSFVQIVEVSAVALSVQFQGVSMVWTVNLLSVQAA